MQLKKIAQLALIISGLSILGACSAPGNGNTDQNAAYNNDATESDAQAAGTGQGTRFGDENGGGGKAGSKNTYYFDFDRSVVKDSDKPSLYANANYLMSHPKAKIILEGHTDPRGSREYNVALGEHRANAVADILEAKGVNASQIRVVSYGAERLAVPGRTEQDFELDRRAVIAYLQK